ncbi:sulfatase [Armatimonas sp.]|uniref:sulfatase n=1 Tax=Armatimonas sp. TaxID=1872638 RepID=UPI00286D43C8|nr:sulfatase [Armatimonas sp.]
MKTILVMFDSLNRKMLPPYGGDFVQAPNFTRLAQRCATFETSYVCSMPCMPARRDLHTGRPNFLHRRWGQLEPFDDSLPELLKTIGIYSHFVTDHYHYWEDGGATYHNRYSTAELIRGQEGDLWIGQVADPAFPENARGRHANPKDLYARQDLVNRSAIPTDAEHSQTKTFAAGLDFIERNHTDDNWFLTIETFDPHEPFFVHEEWRNKYPGERGDLLFDWPYYKEVSETPEEVTHIRTEYAALVTKCDHSLGLILDAMDRHKLWDDTQLIVWTDHGFLLGEHDLWAKIWMPFYDEVAHTPFFIWDPRFAQAAGQRRTALVQPSIDLAPTILGFFGLQPTPDMRGKDLAPVLESDTSVREAALFGMHGAQVNVTDGRYVYWRAANEQNAPLYNYTLCPTVMRGFLPLGELAGMTAAPPFSFTKACPVMKIPTQQSMAGSNPRLKQTVLWDLHTDPSQTQPCTDAAVEARLLSSLDTLLREYDAPLEQWERLSLEVNNA